MSMTMTITEALNCPKGMDFEKYAQLLGEKAILEKKLRRINFKIYELQDRLNVLEDEKQGNRYRLHKSRLDLVEKEKDAIFIRLGEIEDALK